MARNINYSFNSSETWVLLQAMRNYVMDLQDNIGDYRDVYDVEPWTLYPEALLIAVYMVREFEKDLKDMELNVEHEKERVLDISTNGGGTAPPLPD